MVKRLPIALLLLLLACGPQIKEGYVIDKNFVPSHTNMENVTRYRMVPQFRCHTVSQYSNGKTTTRQQCGTEMVSQPYSSYEPVYYPDDWDLHIEKCEVDDRGREKCKRRWIDVTKSTHDSFEIGNYYNNGKKEFK